MFLESEEGAGFVYAVPDACLFRITNDPLVHAIDRGGVVWLSAHRGVPSALTGLREGPMEPKVRSASNVFRPVAFCAVFWHLELCT